MMCVWVWLAALVTTAVLAHDAGPFAVPVEERFGVEYYDNGESRFAIFLQQATWSEATQVCAARRGRLVEYLDDETPLFIGRALAESAVGYSALWIGGEFVPSKAVGAPGVWTWTYSQRDIDAQLSNVSQFPMTSWPYWVDRPPVLGNTPMCLATDRNLHHRALIVAAPCNKKKPFICAMPGVDDKQAVTKLGPPIPIATKNFHLFKAEVAWDVALSQCQAIGMKLAKVTTESEFRIIGNRMIRSRPIVESAWISGKFENGEWTWFSNNEAINVNKSKADAKHPFPWHRPDNIIMEGCLLADRHVCDHFVYVEAKCDRKRNFICEEGRYGAPPYLPGTVAQIRETHKGAIPPPIVQIPGTDCYVSSYEEDWQKAQNICRTCLGGDLLQIEGTKEGVATQLPMLYEAMALTLPTEIRHIWLGGYLFKHKFKWTTDQDAEPGDDKAVDSAVYDALHSGGERGRLTYCHVDFTLDDYLLTDKCLNMDRENEKEFIMYGLKCRYRQHFICSAPPGAQVDASCGVEGFGSPRTGELLSTSTRGARAATHQLVTESSTVADGRNYKMVIGDKLSWHDAQDYCKSCYDGDLVEVDGGESSRLHIMEDLYRKVEGLKDSEGKSQAWLGGYHFKNKFKWGHDPNTEPGEDRTLLEDKIEALKAFTNDSFSLRLVKNEQGSEANKCLMMLLKGKEILLEGRDCSVKALAPCLAPKNYTIRNCTWFSQHKNPEARMLPMDRGRMYWRSAYNESWPGAQEACRLCLGGQLADLAGKRGEQWEKLQALHSALNGSTTEVRQTWLGGYLFNGTFKWANSSLVEPPELRAFSAESFQALNTTEAKGRIQFVKPKERDGENTTVLMKNCLVLDLKEGVFKFQGWICSDRRNFICETSSGTELDPSCKGKMIVVPTPPERKARLIETKQQLTSALASTISTTVTNNDEDSEDGGSTPWLAVRGYDGYWVNNDPDNWEDSSDSCRSCLSGDLLQLTTTDRGQANQLRIIREALKSTLRKKLKRIWLGSFELSDDSKWLRNVTNATSDGHRTEVKVEAYTGKPQSSPHKCAALTLKNHNHHIVGDTCTWKRHAICVTRPNVTLDPACIDNE